MIVLNTIKEVRDCLKDYRRQGKSIGLVPTMGYLHEGHGSLIQRCRQENDVVVVSVLIGLSHDGRKRIDFVPIDFAPHFE